MNECLPCKIGSKITLEEYNNFLIRKESSGYKYQRKSDGDVANRGVFFNPPIVTNGDGFHFDPTVNGGFIAADVAVAPHLNHVQQPIVLYPGPPPGDKNKMSNWLNVVHVRYVIGIKLHDKRTITDNRGRYHRSMTALLFRQGVAGYQIWDFGTHQLGREASNTSLTGCNAPNIPAFQINNPVNQVFWDPTTIPAAAGYVPALPPAVALVNFTIDLYVVQQVVLDYQAN
ncbi:17261_t:CDS:2 [Rhizophagus irregularis]|nr:17261_t:CDS:2 [Rhizophagus irregularis]